MLQYLDPRWPALDPRPVPFFWNDAGSEQTQQSATPPQEDGTGTEQPPRKKQKLAARLEAAAAKSDKRSKKQAKDNVMANVDLWEPEAAQLRLDAWKSEPEEVRLKKEDQQKEFWNSQLREAHRQLRLKDRHYHDPLPRDILDDGVSVEEKAESYIDSYRKLASTLG